MAISGTRGAVFRDVLWLEVGRKEEGREVPPLIFEGLVTAIPIDELHYTSHNPEISFFLQTSSDVSDIPSILHKNLSKKARP